MFLFPGVFLFPKPHFPESWGRVFDPWAALPSAPLVKRTLFQPLGSSSLSSPTDLYEHQGTSPQISRGNQMVEPRTLFLMLAWGFGGQRVSAACDLPRMSASGSHFTSHSWTVETPRVKICPYVTVMHRYMLTANPVPRAAGRQCSSNGPQTR